MKGHEMKILSNYEHIVKYRKMRKQLMLDGFGCKCQICGYNKCNEALEFHHLDPSQKDMALSKDILSWSKTINELKKCICVCANCHREIHQGLINIDTTKQYFDETKVKDYDPTHCSKIHDEYYDSCPVCGKRKLKWKRACCRECYNKLPKKVDWSKIDVIDLIANQHVSMRKIGQMVGVSGNAVKKHYLKIKN